MTLQTWCRPSHKSLRITVGNDALAAMSATAVGQETTVLSDQTYEFSAHQTVR
jgi:hypothetical protein